MNKTSLFLLFLIIFSLFAFVVDARWFPTRPSYPHFNFPWQLPTYQSPSYKPSFTPSCSNECILNQRECGSLGTKTCGNYDTDSCLEWGQETACAIGEYCSTGACVFSNYPCNLIGPLGCSGDTTLITCEISSSGDLSYKYTPCPIGQTCRADGQTCN